MCVSWSCDSNDKVEFIIHIYTWFTEDLVGGKT